MKNIYDPVLTVTFRIFGEQDMGLSNEHRDGRFTVFTTGLLGARHTTLKRLCSFREQFFGHRGGKITKGEENLNQLPVMAFNSTTYYTHTRTLTLEQDNHETITAQVSIPRLFYDGRCWVLARARLC